MKKIVALIFIVNNCCAFSQTVFWQENFGIDCGQGTLAANYVSPNGMWFVTSTGPNALDANKWYISSTENALPVGQCGAGCGGSNTRTLHISNVFLNLIGTIPADGGAVYYAGGLSACTTDKRADSPNIDCYGKHDISLLFNYIENGQGYSDNATLWYFDGYGWSEIADMPKTSCCGGPCNGSNRGVWQAFSIQLPASANNNPNVRIGFRWINNNDGMGTDPSFAVSDIRLTSSDAQPPQADFVASSLQICKGSCIDFTDLSSNNPISWNWIFQGSTTPYSSIQNPDNICYHDPGFYSVQLIATNETGSDTTIKQSYIHVLPSPVLQLGDDQILSEGDSIELYAGLFPEYSWSTGDSSSMITVSTPGTYSVTVTDEYGCQASDQIVISGEHELGFTNIVTPNGDGRNDSFVIINIEFCVKNKLEVFNRWGQVIFEADGYNNSWEPSDLSEGVYFYVFECDDVKWNGSLTILK